MVGDNLMLPVILAIENLLDTKLGEHNFSWHRGELETHYCELRVPFAM
jgi:hypothetical protein